MDHIDNIEREQRRMQRRELLKKSAVVGAAAWAAPTIVSSTAHATHGGTCPDDLCEYYYAFKIEGGCDASFGNANSSGACRDALRGLVSGPVYVQCVATNVTDDERTARFTLPPGFSVIAIGYKQGNGCISNGPLVTSWVHTTVNGEDCHKRYTVQTTDKAWSHLEVIVCGPTAPSTMTTYF